MTGIVILNQGEEAVLQDGVTGVAYTLRLYKTDVTAGLTADQIDELDETDFTEATFPGYAAASVGTGDWTIVQGNPTTATNLEKSFTRSSTGAAENIWGYYVTRTSDGLAVWFEPFDGPIPVEFINDEIEITPRITLDDTRGNQVEAGTIVATGRATAPTGYLLCDGTAVSRTTYADLFAAIGTAYGPGDGSTTFGLPNLQQRFPLGKATSGTGATLGGTGGTIDHVHDLNSATSHAKFDADATGGSSPQHFRKTGMTGWTANIAASGGWNAAASASARTRGIGLGGNSAAANPPFQTVNYIVKT